MAAARIANNAFGARVRCIELLPIPRSEHRQASRELLTPDQGKTGTLPPLLLGEGGGEGCAAAHRHPSPDAARLDKALPQGEALLLGSDGDALASVRQALEPTTKLDDLLFTERPQGPRQ